MADKKISALTAATTPLDGTEVLPIVQSSTTVKVANNDLRPKQIQSNATSGVLQVAGPGAAATRVMTTPDANFTAARTDAAQTFSGVQTFSGSAIIGGDSNSTAGVTAQGTNTNNGIMQLGSTGRLYQFRGGDYQGVMELYTASGAGDILFTVSNTTRGRINSSGFKPIAGNGIDFSANTGAAGMTSQLLNWYEQGTWTPTDGSGAGLTFVSATGRYTRVGRLVTVQLSVVYPITLNGATATMSGLPFAASGAYAGACMTNKVSAATYIANGATAVNLYDLNGLNDYKNSAVSNGTIIGTITYFV